MLKKSVQSLIFSVTMLLLVSFQLKNKEAELTETTSPLSAYGAEWDNPKYQQCNTAANATYLSSEEKKVIYILNMARMNPSLFATTVVQQYPDKGEMPVNRNSSYYKSLLKTMQSLQPMGMLAPDSLCFKSALCHATTTGKAGTVTHDRTTNDCRTQQYFSGECCHYGYKNALAILISLLIDEGIPSLGHRKICLGGYTKLGVSIQPHKAYNSTAVLDFK